MVDKERGIFLSRQNTRQFGNELTACHVLGHGMWLLFQNVLALQDEFKARSPFGDASYFMCSAHAPAVLLHLWFSVTACNFSDGMTFFAIQAGAISSEDRTKYRASIDGPIRAFRDKIGGHLVAFRHNARDTEAERALSTLAGACVLLDGVFHVPVGNVVTQASNGDFESSELIPWSIQGEFARLYDRFFSRNDDYSPEHPSNITIRPVRPPTADDHGSIKIGGVIKSVTIGPKRADSSA